METSKSLGMIGIAGLILAGAGCASGTRSGQTASAPDAVRSAVLAAHPGAAIRSIKPEKEEIDEFEVEFIENGQKMSADVAPDGTIIETEQAVAEGDVPAAARDAIRQASDGGQVKGYEKATITAKADKATNTATMLDQPVVHYEADLAKNGMHAEVAVTADGQIAEAPKWTAHGSD